MKTVMATTLAALLLGACAAEKTTDTAATDTTATTAATVTSATIAPTTSEPAATASAQTSTENHTPGTWAGQLKVGQPISMFNYVGAESGDFAPMRFRNDSEVGRKILAACSNDDMCEFTGAVEWLDEPLPENASALGQIVRVDSVKRLPPEAP